MEVKLISHINADEDLLPAWFAYYLTLGVTSFHIIVHGSEAENTTVFQLARHFPVVIEDVYEGEFNIETKKMHLQHCLNSLKDHWIILVDSDEFIELPFRGLRTTIRRLESVGANILFAPMIQRIKDDGTLNTPDAIPDPFRYFPLCSLDLYERMGGHSSTSKYPLFFCDDYTFIFEGGNHISPNGLDTIFSGLRGVTHHFKWKKSVLKRLTQRTNSSHKYWYESASYLRYLKENNNRLPTAGTFFYSRQELMKRGLLKRTPKVNERAEFNDNESWLREFDENTTWLKNSKILVQKLNKLVPEGELFILVDENQLRNNIPVHIRYVPFLEKNGDYCGLPDNDATAISELERLRKDGIKFIAFAWTSFWWLNFYIDFKNYLAYKFKCLLEDEAIIVFDLRHNVSGS